MSYEEQQSDEMDALQAIYPSEFKLISSANANNSAEISTENEILNKFSIKITNESDNDNDCDNYELELSFELPKNYPDVGPIIEIVSSKNLEDCDELKILDILNDLITENLGTVMVFTMITTASDWILNHLPFEIHRNGTKFEENIIQVDSLTNNKQYDHTKSLFLGNLSFKTTENELREFFNDCGEIQSIRIVRDSKTGIGKGFGYVNFKSNDSVVLAMEKNGQLFKNREIRIKQYEYTANGGAAKNDTNKQSNKKRSAKVKTLKKSPKVAHQGEHGVKKAKAKKLMRKSLKNRINVAKKKIQKEKISKLIQ